MRALLVIALLSLPPTWALSELCCHARTCHAVEHLADGGQDETGYVWCEADTLCHDCGSPCLSRWARPDGGVACVDRR